MMSAGLVNALNEHLLLERKRQAARKEGYEWALYDIRNGLLIAALRIMAEWRDQLARDGERVRSTTQLKFAAQLQGLNEAFEELSKIEPRITTRLEIEKLQESAFQDSQFGCQPKSVVGRKARTCGAFIPRYPDVDQTEFEAGYRYTRDSLGRRLFSVRSSISVVFDSAETAILEKRAVREIAIAASRGVRDNWGDRGRGPERLDHPDFDRGSRKAIMDWSHEHNRRLAQVIQILNDFMNRETAWDASSRERPHAIQEPERPGL